jgi:hypothetical protein
VILSLPHSHSDNMATVPLRRVNNVLVPLPKFPVPRFLLRKNISGSSAVMKCTSVHGTETARLCLHQGSSDSTPKIAHTGQPGNRLRHLANRSRQRYPVAGSHMALGFCNFPDKRGCGR